MMSTAPSRIPLIVSRRKLVNHDVKVKNVLIEEERERFCEKETGCFHWQILLVSLAGADARTVSL